MKRKYKRRKIESGYFLKRLYDFLRFNSNKVIFKKLYGGVWGYCDYGPDIIILDYRRGIIPTLIHEFLHRSYPSWSETKILRKEREIIATLSPKQCENIIKNLAYSFE
jgi:hypothetical protein